MCQNCVDNGLMTAEDEEAARSTMLDALRTLLGVSGMNPEDEATINLISNITFSAMINLASQGNPQKAYDVITALSDDQKNAFMIGVALLTRIGEIDPPVINTVEDWQSGLNDAAFTVAALNE